MLLPLPCLPLPLPPPLPPRRCLPTNRSEWSDHLETQRKLYARFVQDFILKPAEIVSQGGGNGSSRGENNPSLGGGATTTSAAAREAAAAAISGGADADADAPKTGQAAPPHRGSTDPHGSPGGDTGMPTPRVARAEGSSAVRGGANGVLRATNGSPERDHPAVEDAATSTSTSTTEATAGVSSPESAVSERSPPGGARARAGAGGRELRPADDDPLSSKETSEWAALWSDKELMQAIDQEIGRAHV